MHLHLKEAIALLLEKESIGPLKKASADLTDRYRHGINQTESFISSDAHRKAYLLCRMPATHAALSEVFAELSARMPDITLNRMLDLGAGPSTAWWAAMDAIPSLESGMFLEQDSGMIALGKKLISLDPDGPKQLEKLKWKEENFLKLEEYVPHPLVVMSYALGELSTEEQISVLHKAWNATEKVFVVIEPGTPRGFETIRQARSMLLSFGAKMVAPCPHEKACPMSQGDWCHFSARLERSKEHRQIKEGTLGYEDEKYSYMIVSRSSYPLPAARVLSHPLKRSGHSVFKLCTPEGIVQETISKKSGKFYKEARKLDWGSSFDP